MNSAVVYESRSGKSNLVMVNKGHLCQFEAKIAMVGDTLYELKAEKGASIVRITAYKGLLQGKCSDVLQLKALNFCM